LQSCRNFEKNGAKSVRAMATHAVFSGVAYENIEKSQISEVIVTDTIPVKTELSSKIKVLSCAALFADVMKMVHEHKSISDKFII
jgi:ribose-phosphate pyrophosphokinase